MTAMPDYQPEQFESLLEFDTVTTPAADAPLEVIQLDLVDDVTHTVCLGCNAAGPVNDQSICEACSMRVTHEPPADVAPQDDVVPEFGVAPEELSSIAAESASNAQRPTSSFQERQVFSNLQPREFTPDAEHTSQGIVHMPTPGSVPLFERPVSERRFIVGQSANEAEREVIAPGKLKSGDVVAGAIAAGNGILVGWHGERKITRAVLVEALRGIGREDWAPKPKDARAQAGRAMAATGNAYHVKADRKGAVTSHEGSASGRHTWRLGRIDTMGGPGDAYGMTVLVMTLEPDGRLHGAGDQNLAGAIVEEYTNRCSLELYTSADLTQWLSAVLSSHLGAVNYAVGWYIPARHRDAAIALCTAVSATGWGNDWLGSKERPALPIATCDELRDGIARGLKDEVAAVLDRLHIERQAAAEEKERRLAALKDITETRALLEAEVAARRLAGDIGPTRAQTFLKELRAIAGRVAAYSEILGDERCSSAKRAVREVIAELEGLLGEADNGISQRFSAVWDEIMFKTRADGGVL